MRVLLCSFALALSGLSANAQRVKSVDFSIHQEYVSTRALGMGNAFTATADDHSSIFYNPANLAFREDGQLRMFLRAGTDPGAIKLIFDEIPAAEEKTEEEKPQAYSDLIESHYGDHFFFRAPTIGAVWVRPGWGIAFIPADLSLDVAVHRQLGPALNINLYMDSTLAFSYARKLKWLPKGHELAWGTTIKSVHRVYVGDSINAGQLADGSDVFDTSMANEGLTGDLDLAMTYKPRIPKHGFFKFFNYFKPTFAIVGRNLVDYGFTQNFHMIDENSGEPPRLQRRADIGTKWDLPKFWVFDPHFSADLRDIGHENWTFRKGSHAGFELYWKMYNWWKGHWAGGFNQGYWTAGLGMRFAWFQLDAVSYGEEVGTSESPQESRRYMVELALDF